MQNLDVVVHLLRFTENSIVGFFTLQGQWLWISASSDRQHAQLLGRGQTAIEDLVSKKQAEEKDVRAEHQQRIVDDLRDWKGIAEITISSVPERT